MESYKRAIENKELSDVANFIFQNSMGSPVIFMTTPTNDTMKANSWGIYGTDLYIKFASGVCLKIAGVSI